MLSVRALRFQRRKYFVNRIKAIRSKAETFAKCTGQDILCLTFDEEGNAHYWGTPAFERFFNIEGVQDVLYRTLSHPPMGEYPMQYNEILSEEDHYRDMIR